MTKHVLIESNVRTKSPSDAANVLGPADWIGVDMADRICSVGYCATQVRARGWCATHYNRWLRGAEVDAPLQNTGGDCGIADCGRRVEAQGYCTMHYQRWLRHGDPLKTVKPTERKKRPTLSAIDRFSRHVEVDHPLSCWVWTGNKTPEGYARFNYPTADDYDFGHRFSVEFFKGQKIPSGMQVDHLCRNTSCVNPDHLEIVSPSENMIRALASRWW